LGTQLRDMSETTLAGALVEAELQGKGGHRCVVSEQRELLGRQLGGGGAGGVGGHVVILTIGCDRVAG